MDLIDINIKSIFHAWLNYASHKIYFFLQKCCQHFSSFKILDSILGSGESIKVIYSGCFFGWFLVGGSFWPP